MGKNIYTYNGQLVYKTESKYKGKKFSILGDSISTYIGWIPEGNAVYYNGTNCGMTSVEYCWWKRTVNALEADILVNNSWSGSRVTTTGGNESAGCMTRCQSLDSNSVNPDVIIVYLGINDFNNEVDLGTYVGKTTLPTSTTTFREAYSIMLNKIATKYKQAEIWCCTLPSCEINGAVGAPEINGNNVGLIEFNDAIRNIANTFNMKIIELQSCGLTYQNQNIYMGDWNSSSSTGLHPNPDGHALMANCVIKALDPTCKVRY